LKQQPVHEGGDTLNKRPAHKVLLNMIIVHWLPLSLAFTVNHSSCLHLCWHTEQLACEAMNICRFVVRQASHHLANLINRKWFI